MVTIKTTHLRQLRLKAGLTKEHALEILEISESMMRKMELGFKRPGIELGIRMITAYKCTLEDIYLPYMSLKVSNAKEQV